MLIETHKRSPLNREIIEVNRKREEESDSSYMTADLTEIV